MPAPHDRSTHSSFAGARRREGGRSDLDWRSCQTRNFLPASCNCASGKLHPRGFFRRVVVEALVPSAAAFDTNAATGSRPFALLLSSARRVFLVSSRRRANFATLSEIDQPSRSTPVRDQSA